MTILEILNKAIELGAADIFLVAGLPVTSSAAADSSACPRAF